MIKFFICSYLFIGGFVVDTVYLRVGDFVWQVLFKFIVLVTELLNVRLV